LPWNKPWCLNQKTFSADKKGSAEMHAGASEP
jgi:hypothetical protein